MIQLGMTRAEVTLQAGTRNGAMMNGEEWAHDER